MSSPRTLTLSSPGRYPSNPIRPPNCTRPPPIVAVTSSRRTPLGIEANRPVDRIERIGQREVTDAPVRDRGAAGKDRFVERTVDRRRSAPRDPNRARRGRIPAGCRDSRRLRREARFVRRGATPIRRRSAACPRRPAADPERGRRSGRGRVESVAHSESRSRTTSCSACRPCLRPGGD